MLCSSLKLNFILLSLFFLLLEETDVFSSQNQEPSLLWSPQETSKETNTAFDLPYPQKKLTRRKCTKISKASRYNLGNRSLMDLDSNSKLLHAAVINKEETAHSNYENVLLLRSSPVSFRHSKSISWQEKETSVSTLFRYCEFNPNWHINAKFWRHLHLFRKYNVGQYKNSINTYFCSHLFCEHTVIYYRNGGQI